MIGSTRALLALAALASTAGCMSMRTPITDFATDYNRVIADTRNEMILLNILRAQHREPVYFSSVSEINGSVSMEASASAGAELSVDGDNATPNASGYSTELGVSMSSAPTFTVVPLNTQEFVRGALTPVRDETIALLRQQGWRGYILAPLLIESIDCGGEPLRNDPESFRDGAVPYRLTDFGAIAIDTVPSRPSAENGGAFELRIDDSDLADLLFNERSSNFSVRQGAERAGDQSVVSLTRHPSTRVRYTLPVSLAERCGRTVIYDDDDSVIIHRRSIEGIIYYLGELRRSGISTMVTPDDPGTPRDDARYLFQLSEGGGPASVRVSYRGQSYAIPEQDGNSPDRTLQVLSLLNQLLALQTSTEDLSRVTPTVRVR